MVVANDILRVAAGEIGYSRWNDAQSGTKYGRDYATRHGAYYGSNGVSYCAMFVTWLFRRAGMDVPGGDFAYCPYGIAQMRRAGLEVNKYNARPGDIVFFDWDGGVSDHVGVVELNKGGYLQTIEGNTSYRGKTGSVARKIRYWGNVCNVFRPRYGAPAPAARPAPVGSLTVDGWFGAQSIRKLQAVMGTPQDGVISSQPSSNRAWVPNASTGWEWAANRHAKGSAVIQAWQRKIGAAPDGFIGPGTVRATQKFLGVAQDGYAGKTTMSAWQTWLNQH